MFVTVTGLLQQQCARDAHRIDVPLNVPFCTGCQWISLDVTGSGKGKNLNWISDLQHSLDFGRSPWKVEVERAKGIEPSALAWEARVLPLYDARAGHYSTSLGAAPQRPARPIARHAGYRIRRTASPVQSRSTRHRHSAWPEAWYLRSKGVIGEAGRQASQAAARPVIRCTARQNSAR